MTALVIFDCDGVLVDSEIIYVDVEYTCLTAAGLRFEQAEYMRSFSGLPTPEWERRIAAESERQTGRALQDDFFAYLADETMRRFETELRSVAGARAAIEAIDGRVCVASSSSTRRLHWKLRHTDLHDLFDPHIFSTDLVENGKPSPDLFLHAAGAMNGAPEQAIVIEDSANGVRAGKAAGMAVVGFVGGGHCLDGHADMLRQAGADRIAESHQELADALERVARTG